MKKRLISRLSIKMQFTLLVMIELVIATIVSGFIVEILKLLRIPILIPDVVWFVVLALAVGGAINNFFGKRFLEPIMKLGRAMEQVADGDFGIRLEARNESKEIREIYSNFNFMVEELSATEILQTDFVSNVSHEFKTPINAIEGYVMLLQDSAWLKEKEQEEYINKILLNTNRLSKLVGNMLLLSKIDNQAIQSKQTKIRLDEQIRQSVVILEPVWSSKEIEFDVDLDEVEYIGNESLLHHVWDNLIGNAIKFSPQAGEIIIKMRKFNNEIIVHIDDNGPGIKEEEKRHIFDRFYQSDSSHKEEGNGLGLALVKNILQVCNGEIYVENLTKGCRFTVKLNT